MIKCIIVDDEPLARKGMQILIDKVDFIEVVAEYSTAIEASSFLSENKEVDLIFLDIEMPGLNGLEFLKSVPVKSQVVLTTAYPQYALEAFELEVIDYLLKPIKFQRFFKAVNRVKELIKAQSTEIYGVESSEEDFFFIKSDRKYVKLFFDEILYIKGMKDYVMITTETGKYMTAMNVGTTMKQLPKPKFARVSKSYIIHTEKITQIDTDFIYLDDVDIPLGESYKENFLNTYVKGKLIGR